MHCRELTGIAAVIILLAGQANAAETYPFRVAFEPTAATDYLAKGELDEGIRVLEQLLASDGTGKPGILATLCGAYVLKRRLEVAVRTCNLAVERQPGETAFNNRGVLRMFRGDFRGAAADFDQARPKNIDVYRRQLESRDVGLVANGNHELLVEMTASEGAGALGTSFAASHGADIEALDD